MSPKKPALALEVLCDVVASAPLILFAVDEKGLFTLSEGRGLDALGLKPGEVVGRSVFDVYAQQPQVLENMRRVLKGESFTAVVPLGDFLYETRYAPLLDWGGKVVGAAGVSTDVSLSHAAALAKDDYLSQLAHELRTPLTTASGWAWLLTQGELSPEELGHAHTAIARSVEELRRMLSEIRDMAAASEGRLRLEPRATDLGALLREAADTLRPAAEAKGLRLTLTAPVVPATGDPARLRQAYWHLLSNAVKFSPSGGEVRAELAARAGAAVLTVCDEGPGVEPRLKGQLFDRARTWTPERASRPRGLGLGLAVVRAVAELHGGSAACEESPRGARFILSLPLPRTSVVPAPPAPARAADRLTGVETMVACADPESGRLAAAALRGRGAKVTLCGEKAAAAALRRRAPRLLVTDILDERGACPLLKALPASARAVALVPEDAALRAAALKAGFSACAGVPPEPRELAETAAAVASGLAPRRPS